MLTDQIPKNPAARRAWIIYQLSLRGLSFAELGRRHGVSRYAVATSTRRPYPRFDRVLAAALDVSVHQLFPERYDEHGQRLLGHRRPSPKPPLNNSTGRTGRHHNRERRS